MNTLMGPQTSGTAHPTAHTIKPTARHSQPVPAGLADVALIDARACAAVGSMSVSWWHEEVRIGRAPKPVIQQPRCTRWRAVDVARYWAQRAEQPAADSQVAASVKAQATKASALARTPAVRAKGQATRQANAAAKTLAQARVVE